MNSTFAFTYLESDGTEARIGLDAMRKLWVEPARSGIVFVDVAGDGSRTEHEVVMDGPEVAEGMAEVMQALLAARSFQRVEHPVSDALLLEFRYPQPSTVALTYRA